ncbi:hypothetical protein OSB04_020684 [Centaurea solstitialis]|uniref:Reverse transcriptase domain-containing protein n=1 Tax=Centaurea solstitialis TaxID=347529 RepID=A0AA38T445_9ASTR|nr:hypothetical protein OSB04_020684 [Centaurea solstitialis]
MEIYDNTYGTWRFTGFYGFPERTRRRVSWNLLRSLAEQSNLPWVVMGDFNDLLSQEEKQGLHEHPDWCIQGFRETLSDCRLMDLSMHGFPFTWSRHKGKPNEVLERLDRAVASQSWINLFPNHWVENLTIPLLLYTHQVRQPYPHIKIFRFENKWLQEPSFDKLFLDSWNNLGNIDLPSKLSSLAVTFKKWGRNLNLSFKNDVKDAYSKLSLLRGNPNPIANAAFEEERQRLLAILLLEEEHWRQRSKVFWLKEGDTNTKFFHAVANGRRKSNRIIKLQDDNGQWVEDVIGLHNLATEYFTRLFSTSTGSPELITKLVKKSLAARDVARLETPFTKEEFRIALFQMHPDKSPGPDGFNPRFYQKFWPVLGDDIFHAGMSWLENGSFPFGVNDTILTLIPKCDSPKNMKEFRPIALCNVILKIVTKVMANRIKPSLSSLISVNQSAFIKDRLITDNVMVAFETLHTMQRNTRKKYGEVALKIDISKAYDRLDWNYLRQMLIALGFPRRWVNMMMLTVESVRYFVRINDNLVGPIIPQRGLRQGDPLSPYLFILCMEGLSAILNHEKATGRIHGCQVARGAPVITHLLFADDAFFFCRASIDESRRIKHILSTYEAASGQAINFAKSGIMFSNNLAPDLKHGLSCILGINKSLDAGRYLGLPSLVGRSKKIIFRHIQDRLYQKLQNWRKRPISIAGRATLIKAAAQAVPVYYMSVFLFPASTIKVLERMLNSFWWGTKSVNSRSINWLSWDKLCVPKKFGGLGFRDFTAFNVAMLGKQAWRLVSNPTSLVSRIYKAKYYPRGVFYGGPIGKLPQFLMAKYLAFATCSPRRSTLESG